ncbi:MAG TPA: hypothetical protein VGK99_23310 [Acidobacteriota bacterium]
MHPDSIRDVPPGTETISKGTALWIFGMVLAWISLLGMYLRARTAKMPKEVLDASLGTLGGKNLNSPAFVSFYRNYKKLFGVDLLIWMLWVSVILIAAGLISLELN